MIPFQEEAPWSSAYLSPPCEPPGQSRSARC